jgi:tagaturonate reductase
VPDTAPYRLRKVVILNGALTALCPLALLCEVPTVGAAVDQPALRAVMEHVLAQEIKPFVPLPQAELDPFAAKVLRRFANPFNRHRWYDISLNGLAKHRDRLLGRPLAYQARHRCPAPIQACHWRQGWWFILAILTGHTAIHRATKPLCWPLSIACTICPIPRPS